MIEIIIATFKLHLSLSFPVCNRSIHQQIPCLGASPVFACVAVGTNVAYCVRKWVPLVRMVQSCCVRGISRSPYVLPLIAVKGRGSEGGRGRIDASELTEEEPNDDKWEVQGGRKKWDCMFVGTFSLGGLDDRAHICFVSNSTSSLPFLSCLLLLWLIFHRFLTGEGRLPPNQTLVVRYGKHPHCTLRTHG